MESQYSKAFDHLPGHQNRGPQGACNMQQVGGVPFLKCQTYSGRVC